MKEVREIPSALIQQWEQEAIEQKLPYTEFGSFLKMKEQNYFQSLERKNQTEKVFTNDARNKLTEHGQKVALETLLSIPDVDRACKFAKFDYEDLKEKLSHGFASAEQKESFIFERDHWFMRLKEKMKEFRISKEVLETFGLSWKDCKTFAYQAI